MSASIPFYRVFRGRLAAYPYRAYERKVYVSVNCTFYNTVFHNFHIDTFQRSTHSTFLTEDLIRPAILLSNTWKEKIVFKELFGRFFQNESSGTARAQS